MDSVTGASKAPNTAEMAAALADSYESELNDVAREKAALAARESRLQRLVADLRREAERSEVHLFEPPPPVQPDISHDSDSNGNGKRPGTGDAIIAVLTDLGQPLTGREVFAELERRHWLPAAAHPSNAVRTALWNLATRGRIRRLGENSADRRWAAKTSSQPPYSPEGGETTD